MHTAPSGQAPVNVLVLLHGLGGTHQPFANFARQVALPETCAVSICAATPLPLGIEGYHWADDLTFDSSTGAPDTDTSVDRSVQRLLDEVIQKSLVEKCGFSSRAVQLFGFGQGGTVALETAVKAWRSPEKMEFGGIVSIGGALTSKGPPMLDPKCQIPLLLCMGSRNSAVSKADKERVKSCFAHAEIVEWAKAGDGMPASREEVLPMMRFWARRLRSQRGVPEGSVEIG
jgi:predicted esterase